MRFGFFFFAEYVNVFVVSALSVVLFFGGWNAPFNWPFPVTLSLDPGGLGLGLIFLIALAPVVGTIVLGLPFWLLSSRVSTLKALVIGFILFNLLVVGAFLGWAFISAAWVSGLVWMIGKTFVFVFIFVQMRGTLPRVRVDQLMSFAWKWLLPAALLNIFVTAVAVSIVANR
jgi:NADH:ubiquinone oxidoreductase subunit H